MTLQESTEPRSRLSLGKAMALTALLANDFAWIRALWTWRGSIFRIAEAINLANGMLLEYGLLGMSNVLAVVAATRLTQGDLERRAYYRGFVAAGLAAMLVYYGVCILWGQHIIGEPRYWYPYGLLGIGEAIADGLRRTGLQWTNLPGLFCYRVIQTTTRIVILTTPQVIVARLGGRLARRIARGRAVSRSS